MKKFFWLFVVLVVVLLVLSCAQRPATGRISVELDVNLSEMTKLKEFEPRLTGYESEVDKIFLTVKNSNNETVYSTETTNKQNPSFSFELPGPGDYSFHVEGKRSDGTRVFYGSRQQTITYGSNNVVINATLVNGTLRVKVEIDETVWERYNVESASVEYKKDIASDWTVENLTISGIRTIVEKTLYPSMYTVKFKVKLDAKDSTITPSTWDNFSNPAVVTIPVEPDRIRTVTFKVVYDSQVHVIVDVEQILLPYLPEVANLRATWDRTAEQLMVSWDYSEQNATFYIYKEIEDQVNGYIYELVGSTSNKNYTIESFNQAEYDRISGIALNAVVGDKESGLRILKKGDIHQ